MYVKRNMQNDTVFMNTKPSVRLAIGKEAMDLVTNPAFQKKWQSLYDACNWATIFQSPQFVIPWYSLYHNKYDPILIYTYEDDELTGLITLAGGNGGREIAAAGRNDAHYQAWIADDQNKEKFIIYALKKLQTVFGKEQINFIHLPPNCPIDWINDKSFRCKVKQFSRPLIKLDAPTIQQLLRKKQFRECNNRLSRLGSIKFEKISNINDFDSVLDKVIVQYDFRQGALYNTTPFKNNPLKKKLYIDLFKAGLMYATVIKLNEEIISSITGTIGENGFVHGAGVNSQSAFYHKYSLGFLNFVLFAQQLASDGYHKLDLSTGGQSYKYRLANEEDTVTGLYVSLKKQNRIYLTANHLENHLKRRGINIETLKSNFRESKNEFNEKWSIVKRHGFRWLRINIFRSTGKKNALDSLLYTFRNSYKSSDCRLGINSCDHLLKYQPDSSLMTTQTFLFNSMRRIELGQIPYTWVKKDLLVACIWVNSDNDKLITHEDLLNHQRVAKIQSLYVRDIINGSRIKK